MPNQMQSPMWAPGINRSQQLAQGLIAYYPLWEGDGSTVMDVVSGNTGAITGLTWNKSIYGPSLFSSFNTYITPSKIYTTPSTFSYMIQATLTTNNPRYLVDSTNGSVGIGLRTNTDWTFDTFMFNSGPTTIIVNNSGSFAAGVPFILTIVKTLTALSLYQDGSLVGSTAANATFIEGTSEIIGNTYDSGINGPEGFLHQVAFWDRDLSLSEVVYLHSMGEHAITERARRQVVSAAVAPAGGGRKGPLDMPLYFPIGGPL